VLVNLILRVHPLVLLNHKLFKRLLLENQSEIYHTNKSAAETIYHSISDSIILFNSEHNIEAMNPSTITLFGFSQSQILGSSLTILFPDDQLKISNFTKN
jgi:PAS domain-containing protein